ncbi:hypothetical protein [Bacillus sp. REN3]|uniref:hypothetical protein n=1 Tax=Bacillus sp. REN3 TaxID=2802440 RepID=UPI001AEF037D|nr:hypothetical protein [Bacillus sp. REN3]
MITAAVIMFFAAMPIGIFIVTFVHQSFYLDKSQWFFDSPISSFIVMVGMLFSIPLLLIIIAIYMSRTEESRRRNTIVLAATFVTILIMSVIGYLSLDNYYYIDRKGIHYDELWKLETISYSWAELTSVKQVNINDGGTLKPEKIIFTYGTEKIDLPLSPKLRNEIEPVMRFIENEKGIRLDMETIEKD